MRFYRGIRPAPRQTALTPQLCQTTGKRIRRNCCLHGPTDQRARRAVLEDAGWLLLRIGERHKR